MRTIEVELYTDEKNGAVLRLPGRQYPGVLVQGDSLQILIDDLTEALEGCRQLERSDEVCDAIDDVVDRLSDLQRRYSKAISASP